MCFYKHIYLLGEGILMDYNRWADLKELVGDSDTRGLFDVKCLVVGNVERVPVTGREHPNVELYLRLSPLYRHLQSITTYTT